MSLINPSAHVQASVAMTVQTVTLFGVGTVFARLL
jgi:hypothetical protein